MPRSTRHKSSKHCSRYSREDSDSEKESGLKERKRRENTACGEKRKPDSEFNNEFPGGGVLSLSNRRKKEKEEDRRREVSCVSGFDVERKEKNGSRSDRNEIIVDIVSVSENTDSDVGITDVSSQEEFIYPEPERDLDRRVGRKRDGCGGGGGDVCNDAVRDPDDRRLSFREEIAKSGKLTNDVLKDHGPKDKISRDWYLEDLPNDIWRQDEKKRDYRSHRDYSGGKSDDQHMRNDKKALDVSRKISKPNGGEIDRELVRDRERSRDHARDQDRGRSRVDHDRYREHEDPEHALYPDQDREDLDRELDRDIERRCGRYCRELRDRVEVRDHERGCVQEFGLEHDSTLHVDEKGSRIKDDSRRHRSPDNYDDYHSDKLKRVAAEVDNEKYVSHKRNGDSVTSSSRHRSSPSSRAYVGADKYRDGIGYETKYENSLKDGTVRSGEKRAKVGDNHNGDFSVRSPNTKMSPTKERSLSTSFDLSRFSRSNTRRSLEVDDAERMCSCSFDTRDVGVTEDSQGRKFASSNSRRDEYPPAELSFHHKSGQANVSSHGLDPGPIFRTRADSCSFVGPLGEDSRGSGSRYRSVDPNVGRGPQNTWNGASNWPSPLPNGFIPFHPGPPGLHYGGFPPIMSQFPPLFGVRPTLDMNHPEIPYHLANGDYFPGHVRPIGWSNMVEGSLPHFHGWNAGNSILRNDSSRYGPEHLCQRRGINLDNWTQNGEVNMDVISWSLKDGPTMKASIDEASSAQDASKPNVERSCLHDQATSLKDASSDISPKKEIPLTPAKGTTDKTSELSVVDETAQYIRAYLVKLDVSMDLADPELYNQCCLAVKGVCERVNDVDLEFLEEMDDVGSEIVNLTMGVKVLPAAKESIFQRAMNLYKTQSSERKTSVVPDGDKICSPSHSQLTFVPPQEIVPITWESENEISISPTSGPLNNSDLALDVYDQTKSPVLAAEKMENNVDEGDQFAGSTFANSIVSDVDKDTAIDVGKIDVLASPSYMCNDSVKVCEARTSVSNESELVVLSRIHHSLESTH